MRIKVVPKKLNTSHIKAPADKSFIIRYMIVAAMKDCECKIRNINLCDDVLSCMDALDNLGGVMNVGQSATVLRLLIPSVIKKYGEGTFVCDGNLINRPMGPYEKFFKITKSNNEIAVSGTIKEEYVLDTSISTQFVSGLMIAGCKISGDIIKSRYIDMTKKVLSEKTPFDVTIPEDETLKAFWNIGNLEIGDADCNPDMVVPWALQLATTEGTHVINNVGRLKYKESNRVETIVNTINLLGGEALAQEDKIIIKGKSVLQGGVAIDPYEDHRIAMLAAIGSQYCVNEIEITNAECVSKSYPNFYEDFEKAGGKYFVI